MEALFILLVFVVAFVATLLIGERALNAVARPPRPRMVSDPGKVGRYAGCITCEGAEAVSMAELIRHQTRDHGAIAWLP